MLDLENSTEGMPCGLSLIDVARSAVERSADEAADRRCSRPQVLGFRSWQRALRSSSSACWSALERCSNLARKSSRHSQTSCIVTTASSPHAHRGGFMSPAQDCRFWTTPASGEGRSREIHGNPDEMGLLSGGGAGYRQNLGPFLVRNSGTPTAQTAQGPGDVAGERAPGLLVRSISPSDAP